MDWIAIALPVGFFFIYSLICFACFILGYWVGGAKEGEITKEKLNKYFDDYIKKNKEQEEAKKKFTKNVGRKE